MRATWCTSSIDFRTTSIYLYTPISNMILTKSAAALLFWGLLSLSVQAAPQPLSSTAVVDPPTAAGLLKAAQEALQKEQQLFNAKMLQQNGTVGQLFIKEDLAEPKQGLLPFWKW